MPYKRKAYRKRAFKPKATANSKVLAKVAVNGLQGAALVKLRSKLGIVKTEDKFVDTNPTAYTATATLTQSGNMLATPIPQGDGVGERSGARIVIKSWQMKGNLLNPISNTQQTNHRIIIAKYGRIQSTAITNAQVLQSTSNIFSYNNTDATQPFTILYDKTFVLNPVATGNGQIIQPWSFTYRPKGGHIVEFLDSNIDGVFGQCIRGALVVFHFADNATVGSYPQLFYSQRVVFTDTG